MRIVRKVVYMRPLNIYYTNCIPKTLVKYQAKLARKAGFSNDLVQFHYIDFLESVLNGKIKEADYIMTSPKYFPLLKSFFKEYSINVPVGCYHWMTGKYDFPEINNGTGKE